MTLYEDYRLPDLVIDAPERTITTPSSLDVFIPDLKLGFEYQGEQHFQEVNLFQTSNLADNKSGELSERQGARNSCLLHLRIAFSVHL